MRQSTVGALTPRQREVLAFIKSRQIPPTIRELSGYFGWKSNNTAVQFLRTLDGKGVLTREPGLSRGLIIPRARPVLPYRGIVR